MQREEERRREAKSDGEAKGGYRKTEQSPVAALEDETVNSVEDGHTAALCTRCSVGHTSRRAVSERV